MQDGSIGANVRLTATTPSDINHITNNLKQKKMDMKKEIELIELRAQVSLLYEMISNYTDGTFKLHTLTVILQSKIEQITELEKQMQNETNV